MLEERERERERYPQLKIKKGGKKGGGSRQNKPLFACNTSYRVFSPPAAASAAAPALRSSRRRLSASSSFCTASHSSAMAPSVAAVVVVVVVVVLVAAVVALVANNNGGGGAVVTAAASPVAGSIAPAETKREAIVGGGQDRFVLRLGPGERVEKFVARQYCVDRDRVRLSLFAMGSSSQCFGQMLNRKADKIK